MVRIKVAKSEFTFSIPIFAKMAVSAAKAAESSAQNVHESAKFFIAIYSGTTRTAPRAALVVSAA